MALEQAGVQLVAQGAAAFGADMSKASGAVNQFSSDTNRAAGQTTGASQIMTGALRHIGTIAVDAFMQAGKAVVGFVTDSIGVAGDFEAGMNQFSAVVGDAFDPGSLKDFRDLFLDLGKELPVSTADVQKAATEMVKGGIEPATIAAGGLKQTIQFAAAAMGGDLVGAAEVSAKILGGWADQNATAAEKAALLTNATDLLTKAANASTVDVKELALGLYNVQGTAKTTGLSLQETTTALAELSPRFASSSEAGTSFKNFLVRLQPTTKPAIAAMEGLGLYTEKTGSAFFDANGKFVGVAKASDLLQDKLKGLTDAQKVSLLQTIFGNDAMNAAAAFAELGAKGFDDMSASMAKANGVQANAATMQQGYNVALDNMKGSFEALQITIGSAVLPVLTDLFNNVLAPAINTVTSFADSIASADDPILALTTAIDSVLPGFKTFIDWLGVVIPQAIAFLMEHTEAIKGALIALGAVIAGAAVAGAIASLMNPITLIIGGVALLGAAWSENWGGIQDITKQVWDFLEPIFKDVAAWLGDNIPAAVKVVSDFWENTLYPALEMVWKFIKDNIIPIVSTLVGTYFALLKTELKVLADTWSTILWPAIQKVWSFLDTSVIPLFTAIARVNIAVFKVALTELTAIWNDDLYPAIEKVYNWFSDKIVPIFDSAKDKGGDLAHSIRETLGPAFDWLGEHVIQPIIGWFDSLGSKIQGIIDFLNDLADKINSLPSIPGVGGGASFLGGGGKSISPIMGAGLMMARQVASATTYNQQRTANLTYNTQVAPPVQQSLAIANALAGGS